ncbi:unnamed protein product [Brachionus calyciflorus]|uniref:Uncharacterized protein n=1 Tax=Brachionus calyciflorus TaxID=104777 RepID=A0A814CBK8_9BILA|nr:unnamed protein product [Brachionus calyciflorus]
MSHSEGLNRRLKLKQNELSLNRKIKLVQEVSTRCHSTLDMLESILLNEDPLKSISIVSANDIFENVPSDEEFDFIYEIYWLSQPLKELTVFFSGCYVTTSVLHPSIYKMVNKTLPEMTFKDNNINKIFETVLR